MNRLTNEQRLRYRAIMKALDFALAHNSQVDVPKSDLSSNSSIDFALAAASVLPPQRLTQNRLVLRILEECASKLKLSVILPKIFENPLTVFDILKDTEYKFLADMLLKYLRHRTQSGKTTVDAADDRYNEELIEFINMFHDNYQVLELLPNWLSETTMYDHNIIEAFDLLTNITDVRLHSSASSEIKKEREIQIFYQENVALRSEIESLRKRVRNQRTQMRWKVAVRTGDSQKFQEELTAKKWQNFNLIRQEQMHQALRIKQCQFSYKNSVQQLKDEAGRLADDFNKLKAANAKNLVQVREEKNKFLIQLKSTIEKHDRVLGEKIKENVYLQDEYDKKLKEVEAVMAIFLAKEQEFNAIMQADRDEEIREWNAKAQFFFQSRAARILQRAWRRYLKKKQAPGKDAKKSTKKSAKSKK